MNILPVRHIGNLRIAAHAKGAGRAVVDVLHLDFLPGQVRLTEPVGEEFFRDAAVLLADLHVEPLSRAVYHARLGQRLAANERQEQCPANQPHPPPPQKTSTMLQNIPTHVIAGPLGAGKTSLIKHLLAQRPANERWAVLINEFGQIGIDAALLTRDVDGIALVEVAGGCLCCINGAPFQIGLGRLLRKARPDRLFIEPSGLGHPAQLLRQLGEAPWVGVLAVQPSVLVLDAQALAAGKPLPVTQQAALSHAGLVLLNKAEHLDERDRQRIAAQLPARPLYWTQQAGLPLSELPGLEARAVAGVDNFIAPKGLAQMPAVWPDPARPICLSQEQDDGWSIGWRWHPGQRFDSARLGRWLESLVWRRAKLVIHSDGGWLSANALDNATLAWQPSEWRQDSRIELIFSGPQPVDSLQRSLDHCRSG